MMVGLRRRNPDVTMRLSSLIAFKTIRFTQTIMFLSTGGTTRSIANGYGVHENTLYECKLQFDQPGESLLIMKITRCTRRSRPLEALGQRIGTGILRSSGIFVKARGEVCLG